MRRMIFQNAFIHKRTTHVELVIPPDFDSFSSTSVFSFLLNHSNLIIKQLGLWNKLDQNINLFYCWSSCYIAPVIINTTWPTHNPEFSNSPVELPVLSTRWCHNLYFSSISKLVTLSQSIFLFLYAYWLLRSGSTS